MLHASKWLSPVNVALSVYAQNPPYSLETVSSSESFPHSVETGTLLSAPKQRLKHFLRSEVKKLLVAQNNQVLSLILLSGERLTAITDRLRDEKEF